MRIGELAKASGVAASRIRFYEEHGVLPPAERRNNGYREYPASAVEILRFIDDAQALGFTLTELGMTFGANTDLPERPDIIAGLQRKHEELGRHIKAAMAKRRRIAALIAELESCDVPSAETARKMA